MIVRTSTSWQIVTLFFECRTIMHIRVQFLCTQTAGLPCKQLQSYSRWLWCPSAFRALEMQCGSGRLSTRPPGGSPCLYSGESDIVEKGAISHDTSEPPRRQCHLPSTQRKSTCGAAQVLLRIEPNYGLTNEKPLGNLPCPRRRLI